MSARSKAWQRESLSEKITEKVQRAKLRLAGVSESLELPLDFSRDGARDRRAGLVPISISPESVRMLEVLAQAQHTTLFSVLLAAYGATLSRLANQRSVVIGSPVSGRTHAECDRIVGFLVNMLVVPLTIKAESDPLELISQAKANVEAALVDQDLPFDRLVEDLGVHRSLAQTSVFQAMFSFQNMSETSLALEGLLVSPVSVHLPTVKYDLSLHLSRDNSLRRASPCSIPVLNRY